MNSRKILDADLGKLANQSNAKPALKRTSGRIGFQQHTGEVRLRNIEIRRLPSAKKDSDRQVDSFFNRKDLTGWRGLPGYWRVQHGAIVGACPGGKPAHTFLVSTKKYRDFDLTFQARRRDGVGNSGVQIRSRLEDPEAFTVVGPQCEIESADYTFPPGSLLTEPDLDPLAVRAPRDAVAAVYEDAGFNDYHIRCVGKHVTIRVNGVTTIDGDYAEMPDEGVIAWQFNGYKPPREVAFRNIELKELEGGFKPVTLNKDLSGWVVEGNERAFQVEEGNLVATSPHWMSRSYLLLAGQYRSYRLRFECKLEAGANSGVVVRGKAGEQSHIGRPGAIDHPIIKLTDKDTYPALPSGGSHWVASGRHEGPTPRDVPCPIGEWNAVEIEVRGSTCQVWINKRRAASLQLDEASQVGQLQAGLAREKGHVGFQANVGTARFRNIDIQEMPAGE